MVFYKLCELLRLNNIGFYQWIEILLPALGKFQNSTRWNIFTCKFIMFRQLIG